MSQAARWVLRSVLAILLIAGGFALSFYTHPLFFFDSLIRWHLFRAGARSEYVTVDGNRIHFYEALPPDGRPATRTVVLVHGLGARAEEWSPLIPTLAASGFHVYALDLLGYGRSAQPADADYSIGLEAKTVVDFMHAVGVSRAELGGWSMGGWVALRVTLDHPEMVDRLMLYDAAGLKFQPTFDDRLFIPTDAAGLTKLSAILTPRPRVLPDFIVRAALQKIKENAWVVSRSYHSMVSGKDVVDDRLSEIHQPTLIVWGQEDHLLPLALGQEFHRGIAGSSLLVVAGCGHLAPSECWRPVLKGTVHFLEANPAPQGVEAVVAGEAEP